MNTRRSAAVSLSVGKKKRTIPRSHIYSLSFASRSASLKIVYSSSPILTCWPPNCGSKTLSPSLTLTGIIWPSLLGAPGPTATTVPSGSVSLSFVGMYKPEAVFDGRKDQLVSQHIDAADSRTFADAFARWIRTRSSRGTTDRIDFMDRDWAENSKRHAQGALYFLQHSAYHCIRTVKSDLEVGKRSESSS